MLNVTVSTLVFFIAVWFLNSYLDAQGIPKGVTRGVMILVLSALMSWGAGWAVDWAQIKVEGPQVLAQNSGAVSQLLKEANQTQP